METIQSVLEKKEGIRKRLLKYYFEENQSYRKIGIALEFDEVKVKRFLLGHREIRPSGLYKISSFLDDKGY